MVIWLVGLSASGKTTLGRRVAALLKEREPNTVYVDGDDIRRVFAHDRGREPYTVEGRRINNDRIAELCAWLDGQGTNVVCSILNIFPERLDANRTAYSEYFEVYVDTPLEVAMKRDARNLYARALAGEEKNVVGLDIPFPAPENPHLTIDNSRDGEDHDAQAAFILERALAWRIR